MSGLVKASVCSFISMRQLLRQIWLRDKIIKKPYLSDVWPHQCPNYKESLARVSNLLGDLGIPKSCCSLVIRKVGASIIFTSPYLTPWNGVHSGF